MSRTRRNSWRTWYARWSAYWFGRGRNRHRSYTDRDGCGKPPGWDRPTAKRARDKRADITWREERNR